MAEHSFGRIYFLYDFIERYIFREYLHEIKIIKNNINPNKDENIIDIGGGTGYIINSIADNIKNPAIIDFSKKMLMQVKNPKVNTIQGTAFSLPFKDGVYNVALLINVLHHIKDTKHKNVLEETFRILKKNGTILVIEKYFPNKFFNLVFNKFEELATGKTYHIKDSELISILENLGFKDINSSYQDWQKMKYMIVAKK
jgi:ubiquinone/menaquinone biosynthesis C-methylase UbiE